MIPRSCLDVPHAGALSRFDACRTSEALYVLEIDVGESTHELLFSRKDFEFTQRLFAILDTESEGLIDRESVKEFVNLRCPVFWRRDEDLKRLKLSESDCPTFDEIWNSVVFCSRARKQYSNFSNHDGIKLGIEGWMVFCRYVAFTQYLEGKRRFSARHLQQTMRHRNSPRESEVVVVDVPPPEPPEPLSAYKLALYENQSHAPLPLPELDLDHNMIAAHDSSRKLPIGYTRGHVKVNLLRNPSSSSNLLIGSVAPNSTSFEFSLLFIRQNDSSSVEETLVRRSFGDLKWLNDTFAAHKVLGGTLCGRILPPFPSFQSDESVLNASFKSTSEVITAAATSGFGRIKRTAKSLVGNYLLSGKCSGTDDTLQTVNNKVTNSSSRVLRIYSEGLYSPCSPLSKVRHVERYLNYLLEHPALHTSFPLNTILTASQSGLEAAKESLEQEARATKEISDQTPHLDDGKVNVPFWPIGNGNDSSNALNLYWVRTAAQAAMALKLHGMLETSGMNSASAILQHASLPSLGIVSRSVDWDEENGSGRKCTSQLDCIERFVEVNSFEDGVVNVQSELATHEASVGDDGYDLLPLPVPAPERRILSAGSDTGIATCVRDGRFHYGYESNQSDGHFNRTNEKTNKAFLGDIAVDENIGKLREVIGSVENILSRCLASIGSISNSRRERQSFHLEVVRGLDSWSGMRGKFVSQRSLLKGVAGIDQSKELYAEGDVTMIDDISWQHLLAKSAVSAAEDVRSAVRVSRTATNAKAAACTAAFAAQNVCDTMTFSSIDEARNAQTRASIANSHAIHAAVVDHEANTVMRRSTLALAHDVKCWNVHRKREILQSCTVYARSQHEATRRAVDAWSSLRDGFIGTTAIPSVQDRRPLFPVSHSPALFLSPSPTTPPSSRLSSDSCREFAAAPALETSEVTASIFTSGDETRSDASSIASINPPLFPIIAVDHELLVSTSVNDVFHDASTEEKSPTAQQQEMSQNELRQTEHREDLSKDIFSSFDYSDGLIILPFATASPITPDDIEHGLDGGGSDGEDNGPSDCSLGQSMLHRSILDDPLSPPPAGSVSKVRSVPDPPDTNTSDNIEEGLSASMQSLVDGLMAWGGGVGNGGGILDEVEDHFCLPSGMAASIVFGEQPQQQHNSQSIDSSSISSCP